MARGVTMARYDYAESPDGGSYIRIGRTAVPCPGVAIRLNTVIDCSKGEDRMPPVTIDFIKNLPQQQQPAAAAGETPQGDGAPAAAQLAGRFTCNTGDFILFSQLRRVEEMVGAAGLPLECAPSVNDFCHLSASNASNTFYKAVSITVEAGAPGSLVVDEDEDEEQEEVPAGAVIGECAICFKVYLTGGATSVKLPCSHAFHRKCLDRWTSVRRTCPYCRAPVPEELDFWDEEDGAEEDHAEHDGVGDLSPGEEYRSFPVPGGETRCMDAVSGSQPSTWSRMGRAAPILLFVIGFLSLLATDWHELV